MLKNILFASMFAVALSCVPAISNAANMIELIDVEQQIQITVAGNSVHVSGANGQVMYVYNVAGVSIYSVRVEGSDKRIDLNLPKGCYIVKVGKTARKISIK